MMDMTKPFAAQDFDALDTFDLDDDFIDAAAGPAREPLQFTTPPGAPGCRADVGLIR